MNVQFASPEERLVPCMQASEGRYNSASQFLRGHSSVRGRIILSQSFLWIIVRTRCDNGFCRSERAPTGN